MTTQASPFRTRIRAGRLGARASRLSRKQRGIAIITTLLVLVLLSLLGLTMAVTANSDMLINSYYGSYRGSFYAADSGLNIARAAMVNELTGLVNMTACNGWVTGRPATGCTAAPLNASTAGGTTASYLTSTYGSFTSLNAGQAATSWAENFMVANTTACPTSVAQNTNGYPLTSTNSLGQISSYTFRFDYNLCAVGRAQALQQVYSKESGSVFVTIQAQGASTALVNTSFAAFGAFIDQFTPCLGPLVYGTMSGPFFTNGAWNFGSAGSYIYTDPVGQADADASFFIGSNCYNSASSSYTKNGTTVAPTFQQGFNLGAAAVPLPANDYTQQWAVIDGKGCGEGGTTCGGSAPPYPT
ncbi:MAG: PilX N-terminal domain-containing pilus assembly protein, partial [Terriglobales bacterium]